MLKILFGVYIIIGFLTTLVITIKASQIEEIIMTQEINENNILTILNLVYIAEALSVIKNKELGFWKSLSLIFKLILVSPILLIRSVINLIR